MSLLKSWDAGRKALIVDDVKSARLGLAAQLKMLGIQRVIEAESGEAAWAVLERDQEIGLVIADWLMPGMSGKELAEKMQADERLKLVPVIMATQRGEWENMAEAASSGIWGYLVKPIEIEPLEKEILTVLEAAREVAAGR